MRKIMIVKKSDLTGTSTKHIEMPDGQVFKDEIYMEVNSEQLKARSNEYWGVGN